MFASIPPCFLSQSCDSVLQVDVLEHVDTVVAAFAPTAYAEDVDIEVGLCIRSVCTVQFECIQNHISSLVE